MRLAAALVVAAALAGCGDGEDDGGAAPPLRACTEIGCLPASAEVELRGLPDGEGSIRICAGGRCRTVRGSLARRDLVRVGLPDATGPEVPVRVVVRSGGRVVARAAADLPVVTSRPNGPDCPPVCRLAQGRLDVRAGRLTPA